jgi:tetratricopeptide (TPR) repeat protein
MNAVPNRTVSPASFLCVALFLGLMSGSLGCGRRGKAPGGTAAASSSASSARPSASALAASLGKDACAGAADRCACAAERGAQLLGACFPDRALQLVSRAPASCATPAFLGVQAESLAALERGDEASSAAKKALQSEPNNRFARRALAIVAIQAQDYDAADAALHKLSAEDAKDVDSLYYLALSQRRRGKYNAAREGFLSVLRLNAQHIDARFNLVTLTAGAGADQEADHHYQELLQIAPVGDPRLISARSALRNADKAAPAELPVLHQHAPAAAPSVAPSR